MTYFIISKEQLREENSQVYRSFGNGDEFVDLEKLTVTNKDITSDFKLTKSCILRKYNGEKELILACGNNPTYSYLDPSSNSWKLFAEHYDQYDYHDHSDAYTIDPDLAMNPSIVGLFGYETFKEIPDNSFEYIEMEGLYANATALFWSELKRISKPNARTCIMFGPDCEDY